jgi:hypothetical protein
MGFKIKTQYALQNYQSKVIDQLYHVQGIRVKVCICVNIRSIEPNIATLLPFQH